MKTAPWPLWLSVFSEAAALFKADETWTYLLLCNAHLSLVSYIWLSLGAPVIPKALDASIRSRRTGDRTGLRADSLGNCESKGKEEQAGWRQVLSFPKCEVANIALVLIQWQSSQTVMFFCLSGVQYMGRFSTQVSALTLGPYTWSCRVNWRWRKVKENSSFCAGSNPQLGRCLCAVCYHGSKEPWWETYRFGKQANCTKKIPDYMSPILSPRGNWLPKHCHSA